MTDQEFYKSAVDFLRTFESVTEEDIDKHLNPDWKKPKDLKIIYKQLCAAARNANMKANVIGEIDKLSPALFEFDPIMITKEYKIVDDNKLLDQIIKRLNPKKDIRREKQSIWPKYCRTLIESAYFLQSFGTAERFYDWTDFFTKDYLAKPVLPFLISSEIYGLGFPLACDFLKELGFVEYGKPDVHLKDIFLALNIINQRKKSIDFEILRTIDRIADANRITSYAVDKIFWLIGSGDFYSTQKKIGSQKKNFIQKMKEEYQL